MEKIKVRGSVVGVADRTSKKTGNPYKIVTVVVGGEVMGLMLNKEEGSTEGIKGDASVQELTLGLGSFNNNAQLDFLKAA